MRDSLKAMLIVHLLVYITIILNVPVVRQITGFFYLTFVPGFVILRVLKSKIGNTVDAILFSAGLSIAFLMFIGLLINELYPLFGISRPLSTTPLLITISGLTLIFLTISYRQDLARRNSNSVLKLGAREFSWQALFLVFLPLLSIVGALYMSNPILLLMIVLIAVLYAVSLFSSRIVPVKLYPLVIFVISISLLFHTSLISQYLMGWDIHAEYYVFKLTEIQGYWHTPGIVAFQTQINDINSMASVTILPAMYSLLLNIGGESIFKLIFPFLFALVPLVFYRIYEQQTGKMVALLAAFFLLSSDIGFYGAETLSLARQMIAQLFVALSIFILVNKNLDQRNKRILFMTFGAAIVVSYYGLAYIYLFYIAFTFILLYRKGSKKELNLTLVLLLFAVTFLWYIYVSNSPLAKLEEDAGRIFNMFTTDLFSTEARSSSTFSALNPTVAQSVVGLVHKLLYYVQYLFIAIGGLGVILKPKEAGFTPEFRWLSILNMFVMALCLIVPNLAPTLNLSRFYMITLPFLAPCFVLGGRSVSRWAEKAATLRLRKPRQRSYRNIELWLVTIVLIASFLFQVGFANHVTGVWPYSYSLDLNRKMTSNDLSIRIGVYNAYVPEQDVLGARWLSENMKKTSKVYADETSRTNVLTSYALLDRDTIVRLYNTTLLEHGTYIYLRYVNVRVGVVLEPLYKFNTTDISPLLNENNKIYSNGDSEIYWAP